MNITFTEAAQGYLQQLLARKGGKEVGVRVFVTDPGTIHAETCLSYCDPAESKPDDIQFGLDAFTVWIDRKSEPFLEEAHIDFSKDRMGGQLTIKAPNAKLPQLKENSSLEEQINYYLVAEINPNLAEHGGMVQLMQVEDGYAILQFGGGCQGCGMVDVTLKQGIETTLKEKIPALKGVKDITDHTFKDNAYY